MLSERTHVADLILCRAQEALTRALDAAKNTAATPLAEAMKEVTAAFAALSDTSPPAAAIFEMKKQLELLMHLCHLLQTTSQTILRQASVIEGAGYSARCGAVGSIKPLFRRYG